MKLNDVNTWDELKFWYSEIIVGQKFDTLDKEVQYHITNLLENIERASKLTPKVIVQLLDSTLVTKLNNIKNEIENEDLEDDLPESMEILDELLTNFE